MHAARRDRPIDSVANLTRRCTRVGPCRIDVGVGWRSVPVEWARVLRLSRARLIEPLIARPLLMAAWSLMCPDPFLSRYPFSIR
jgi:hypothetical protein